MSAPITRVQRLETEARALQRRWRQGIVQFLAQSNPVSLLTAPIIYSIIVPVALLDAWMSLYQALCFPAYGIPRVVRRDYVVLDRHRLGYLNAIEKANCAYCGYVNGVFAYVREIAGRTEEYWCPIKHARTVASPHPRYAHFLAYGDAEGYRRAQARLRQERLRGLTPQRRRRRPR